MTPIGPPKRAPKDVPPEAALYLDNAAEYLSELVKKFGLELKPYDQYRPEHSAWFHALYGSANERRFCIQIVTNEEMAPTFTAMVKGYVCLHLREDGEVVYPRGSDGDWLHYNTTHVNGMAGLMDCAARLTEALRTVCVLRMPHPTCPDPKA